MLQSSLRRVRPRRASRFAAAAATTAFGLIGLGASSAHAQVNFYVSADIDLSATSDSVNNGAQYIGNNPSAVAWNGSTAYIGGYNSATTAGPAALIGVSVSGGAGTLGASSFGAVTAPAGGRGVTALAVQGNTLAASVDFGTGNTDSIRAFNTADNSLRWSIGTAGNGSTGTTQRGNGVAFDPGVGGVGAGVSYLSIGGGRRQVLDPATGAYIYGPSGTATPGFILNGTNTVWRDVAYDPTNGDLYAREANTLFKAVRNGANGTSGTPGVIGNLSRVTTVDNENLAFVNAATGSFNGKFLLLNDRPNVNTGVGNSFLKAFDTSGTQLALNFFDASGASPFTFGNSVGAYDFSWDQTTQTLAMTDFSNRRLYILSLQAVAVPEPGTLGLLALGLVGTSGVALRRRRRK